uniref:RNA helicase n=1 Tax=Echeneis naucrates TaxID=173247 RepID=A0A665X863_ECHNA
MEDIRHLRYGVVTQLSQDHGLIDGAVYFNSAEVLGGIRLKQGDLVNCMAVRDGTESGLEKGTGAPKFTITSLMAFSACCHILYIFLCFVLGYEPMKGDWVQAKYFINPNQWTTQAHSVAPLRYCRRDQICVTSVYGNNGVVEDSVYFSLDSLLLPANYKPSPGHLVNLVMVESSHSIYNWRALCMAPCLKRTTQPTELQSILENKGELDVTNYGQFGQLMIGERRELVLWIQNKGPDTQKLKYCDFAGWDSQEQFTLVTVKGSTLRQKQPLQKNGAESACIIESGEKLISDENSHSSGVRRKERAMDIPPGERLSVVVACQAKSLGSCAELLLLHFTAFTIGRRLEVTVVIQLTALIPFVFFGGIAIYVPLEYDQLLFDITFSASRVMRRRLPNFLPNYPVPMALKHCVDGQGDVLVVQPSLGEVLSPSNMCSRFSTLLWLEELHAEKELREFTITGALLRKGAVYLHLEVLGLAEGRPSLNIGDKVVLKKPLSDGLVIECISYVTEIHDENVSLRVNSEFQRNYFGEPLDVEPLPMFYDNSFSCYCAVLFPSRVTPKTPQWTGKWMEEPDQTTTIEDNEVKARIIDMNVSLVPFLMLSKPLPNKGHFFNPDLNPPQREAVKRILEGECRPIPYVLFGPPGTGKTITLIEAILQVYHFVPSSRVLVCTPSNSAADLICIRLHDSGFLDDAILARVNASSRQEEVLNVRSYSRAGEDIRHASFHRIVVSTCSSAGMFHNIGLQVGHFTHVFLDEAGQATEPESLIPMSLLSERDGQIVLAGDPCQLGPIVKSKLAANFGLGVSLLERLMASPLYCRHDWGYNPKLVTKLIYNYRSHEALLTLPSKLFYQEELCFKAHRAIVDSLCQWKNLPKKGFPLLFHGVRGTEMREGNNPSWFNPGEAVQVMIYCCQLAKKLYNPVHVSDIGIIAPYKKQCEKIRVLLGKVGLSDIKVGSVEEFQGQEFLVIIMSTVRSNESVQSSDLQGALGFLANPKRFNVAVTRPKALLLIVGNPHILIRDSCFRALLQYCFINGAYVGCDPPPYLRESQM